ncbi:MAG: hypothetical protein ABJN04_09140 [Hyphomicrobiales bacterium]
MGASFETWDAVTDAAYYVGAGSEGIWLAIAVILCVVALMVGHSHESKVNKD